MIECPIGLIGDFDFPLDLPLSETERERQLISLFQIESTKKESYYTQIEKKVQTLEESQVCVLTSASAQYGILKGTDREGII